MPSKRSMSKRNPPPPAIRGNNNPGLGSTIMGNLFTGLTFGAGSSLGHRAVDGVMGNREVEVKGYNNNKGELTCERMLEFYESCMRDNTHDCKYIEDMFKLKCISQ